MAWAGFFPLIDINFIITTAVLRGVCQNIQGHFVSGMEWVTGAWTMLWLPQVAISERREKSWTLTICIPGPVTEESPCRMTLWKCAGIKKEKKKMEHAFRTLVFGYMTNEWNTNTPFILRIIGSETSTFKVIVMVMICCGVSVCVLTCLSNLGVRKTRCKLNGVVTYTWKNWNS